MEFMDGGSVLDHVPLAEQHIAIVVREVLLGLRCLMEDRKLHRDIKCGA
jgi:serine/threonine protein kinase